jgi:hypothetical protein
MAKVDAARPTFSFAKGINSDASQLAFPADFAKDMENYEIQTDSSIRRRGGLEVETTLIVPNELDADAAYRVFKWINVNEDPTINFIVFQIGSTLYFVDDEGTVPAATYDWEINLLSRKVTDSSDDDVLASPVQIVSGRGHLFVVGKYIKPFYVAYDAVNDEITVHEIDIKERDFQGFIDGIPDTAKPLTISSAYNYNLLNAGWKQSDIATFFGDKAVYPSKNMIPWLAYRRTATTGVAEQDGTKEFSSDKIIAELFQDAPAPKGHFIRTAFDTATIPFVDDTVDFLSGFTSFSPGTAGVTNTILLTSPSGPHGLSPGDEVIFQIANDEPEAFLYNDYMYVDTLGNTLPLGLAGVAHEVIATPAADTYTIEWDFPADYSANTPLGDYIVFTTITQVDTVGGSVSPYRPTTVEFFAGRVWYAGTPYRNLSSKIFFSQVVEAETQYGKCYQVADPTDENISDLIPTDGGVLSIPDMREVKRLKAYSSRLLVYATNGVWEIGPGASGYFTADSYSIRKISDVGTTSAMGVCSAAEGQPYYWGVDGIYTVIQDTNTGYLTSQSVTNGVLNNLYNNIPIEEKEAAQCVYDDINRRLLWLYGDDDNKLVLILDLKFGGFYKFRLPDRIKTLFTPKSPFEVDDPAKIKYLVNEEDNGAHTIETTTNRDSYVDHFGAEEEAYILHGFDTAGAPQLRKTTPLVTVFSKRTEEVTDDDPLTVGNLSSTLLQARWDWSDNSVSGKWGSSQEVYRNTRMFLTPAVVGVLDDGYPMVVTRNKVRGRGRCVQFKLTAGEGKNSHIMGWATNFSILTDT